MRWIALCLMFAAASPAAAETFELAGHAVTIEPPAGFCRLDRDHPVDQYIFSVTEDVDSNGSYLLQAAPCDSLDDWRNGFSPSLHRYMNAVTPLFDGAASSAGNMARSEFLSEMKRALPQADLAKVQAELERIYEGEAIAPTGLAVLGVVGEDRNALYVALAATFENDLGAGARATVWAITLLNSIPVYVYLTDDLTSGVHDELAAELAPYMAELVRLNP